MTRKSTAYAFSVPRTAITSRIFSDQIPLGSFCASVGKTECSTLSSMRHLFQMTHTLCLNPSVRDVVAGFAEALTHRHLHLHQSPFSSSLLSPSISDKLG